MEVPHGLGDPVVLAGRIALDLELDPRVGAHLQALLGGRVLIRPLDSGLAGHVAAAARGSRARRPPRSRWRAGPCSRSRARRRRSPHSGSRSRCWAARRGNSSPTQCRDRPGGLVWLLNETTPLIRARVAALRSMLRRHPTMVSLGGGMLVAVALAIGLAGHGHDFIVALGSAPIWVLGVAVALHVLWLLVRSEAWRVCIGAAGGTVGRRRLYQASSLGYLGNIFNGQFGLAVRIAALRRSAPRECPRAPGAAGGRAADRRDRGRTRRHLLLHPGRSARASPGGCRWSASRRWRR